MGLNPVEQQERDIHLIAEEVARLGEENIQLRRDVQDTQNRHDALRLEYDQFREVTLEQLGISSLRAIRAYHEHSPKATPREDLS